MGWRILIFFQMGSFLSFTFSFFLSFFLFPLSWFDLCYLGQDSLSKSMFSFHILICEIWTRTDDFCSMTWNGQQGFQTPIANDSFLVDGIGALGRTHTERGLTYYEVALCGHMCVQYWYVFFFLLVWMHWSLFFFGFFRVPEYSPVVSRSLRTRWKVKQMILFFFAQAAFQIMQYLMGFRDTPWFLNENCRGWYILNSWLCAYHPNLKCCHNNFHSYVYVLDSTKLAFDCSYPSHFFFEW